jgi:hypothetical protein
MSFGCLLGLSVISGVRTGDHECLDQVIVMEHVGGAWPATGSQQYSAYDVACVRVDGTDFRRLEIAFGCIPSYNPSSYMFYSSPFE